MPRDPHPDATEMIEARHPDPEKRGTRVNRPTYEAYRAALLEAIPVDAEGVPFSGLAERVAVRVPDAIRERTSPGWWTTTVKLDLEARGLIERVPGSGRQRLRRVAPSPGSGA